MGLVANIKLIFRTTLDAMLDGYDKLVFRFSKWKKIINTHSKHFQKELNNEYSALGNDKNGKENS